VVGLGASGRAAAALLTSKGCEVLVYDDDTSKAAGYQGSFELVGREGLERAVRACDVVVVSPGVKPSHEVFSLAGKKARSEIWVAAQFAEGPIIGVTGTNGKTTVTTLLSRVLNRACVKAIACGNIGLAFSEAVATDPKATFVVEASSFQLATSPGIAFHGAVWLNLTPDHLDWHGSLEAYVSAKEMILSEASKLAFAVANGADPVVSARVAARLPRGRIASFDPRPGAESDFRLRGGEIEGKGLARPVSIAGARRSFFTDVLNYLAVTAAACRLGATEEALEEVIAGFEGLPHRMEFVREVGGVRYYNDSKSTTPASTLAALEGLSRVVLIAGGRNKGLDMGVLAQASERIKAAVLLGECALEIEQALRGSVPTVVVGDMTSAVAAASEIARPGDVVVLSPAAASFDMFSSYEERGDAFKKAVLAL
jgi:UDP-N-acetylmuramoylalanine--D-glutamate ligase